DILQGCDARLRGDVAAFAHVSEAEPAGERRAHFRLGDPRLIESELGLENAELVLRQIKLLLADAALLEKYAMPLHLLLGQSYARPNALALGDQLGIIDLEQKLPGLHVRALLEE